MAPPFLTSAPDGVEWSASHPCIFTPKEGAFSTHWLGGWAGLRANLYTVIKESCPARNRTWAVRPISILSYPDSYILIVLYYIITIIIYYYYYYYLLLYCHIIKSVYYYSCYIIILILCINLDLSHIMYNDTWMK
jgi:hypothetical protein